MFFLLILLEDEVILDTIIKVRLIGHMHLIINGPATTGLCLVTGEWMVKYLTKYSFIWGYIIFPPTTVSLSQKQHSQGPRYSSDYLLTGDAQQGHFPGLSLLVH